MNWRILDALEAQAQIYRMWRKGQQPLSDSMELAGRAGDAILFSVENKYKAIALHAKLLPISETYYVDLDICGLIRNNLASTPEDIKLKEFIHHIHRNDRGFVYFSVPMLMLNDPDNDVMCIHWIMGGSDEGDTIYAALYNRNMVLCQYLDWGVESSLNQWQSRPVGTFSDVDQPKVGSLTHFSRVLLLNFLAFIGQTIVAESKIPSPRSYRRRAERENASHQEFVKVIHLRRAISKPTGEHRDVDWQCRWIVRGHWRQQYIPGSDIRRPTFISQHIKGPEDKPMRSYKVTIFEVDR